jgi:hypothetical protein
VFTPPGQQRRSRDEQVVTGVVGLVVVPRQLPEVADPFPPQPVDGVGQRRVDQRGHFAGNARNVEFSTLRAWDGSAGAGL